MPNNDLIEPLKELEYMFRETVVFSPEELQEIELICKQILNHISFEYMSKGRG